MRPAICALLCLTAFACGSDTDTMIEASTPSSVPLVIDVLRRPTTPGPIALANLNAQIADTERRRSLDPGHSDLTMSLAATLLTRTQYLGSYDDFARVDSLTQEAVEQQPTSAEAWLARATYLAAVHRFDEALTTLTGAEMRGAPNQDGARATIWLATGRQHERVLEIREAEVARGETYESLVDLAVVYAMRGEYERADQLYIRALEIYRDVSPLPVAWVSFQRGVMWSEMADQPDLAEPLYREAVRRVPDYVAANVHLAELEHASQEEDRAILRLERIAEKTADPEPSARLASWLSERGDPRADMARARAETGYESLLARYEAAFRDHASEFYANAGEDQSEP